MSKSNLSHADKISRNTDLPVASRLGYLTLKKIYAGQVETAAQTAHAFKIANDIVWEVTQDPKYDTAKFPLTQEFFAKAMQAVEEIEQSNDKAALKKALGVMMQLHCDVAA